MLISTGGYGFANHDAAQWQAKMRRVALVLARAYKRGDFDAVAVQGSSGVSAIFAARALLPTGVDFPIIVVRKDGEGSHAGKITAPKLTGLQSYDSKEIRKIVVLDDLVSSGATILRIVRELNQKAMPDNEAELVRVYTYNEPGSAPRYHWDHGFAIVAIQ
jgi:adenine/guanine phosphoribosyltransferase-like PRPP-binding protein